MAWPAILEKVSDLHNLPLDTGDAEVFSITQEPLTVL